MVKDPDAPREAPSASPRLDLATRVGATCLAAPRRSGVGTIGYAARMSPTPPLDALWTNPHPQSAFGPPEELGVPYELVEVSLADAEHRRPSYRALTGRIPALVHRGLPTGEFWLAESQAIVEYLAELFPPPQYARLLPEDRVERAVARQIQAWIRSDLMPIREERSTSTIWYAPSTTPLSEKGRAARDRLVHAASTWLGEREQLFSTWSIADADLALMLRRLVASGDDVPEPLKAYGARQFARPSMAKWDTPPRPPHAAYRSRFRTADEHRVNGPAGAQCSREVTGARVTPGWRAGTRGGRSRAHEGPRAEAACPPAEGHPGARPSASQAHRGWRSRGP